MVSNENLIRNPMMRRHVLAIGLFVLVITVMTFPLIFKLNSYMPGFYSSDESYEPVWFAWWTKFCFTNHIPINPVSYLAYPFGNNYNFFGYLFFLINFLLALLTNPVFTYNFQVLTNLFLSSLFAYLLSYVITRNRFSAFISGLIFGFCPYMFVRSWQHLGETYLWMMPMVLWILFALKEENANLTKKILLGISILLSSIVMGTAYYSVIIIALFLLYFLAYLFITRHSPHNSKAIDLAYFKNITLSLGIGYLFVAVNFFAYIKNAVLFAHTKAFASNPYHRPFEDLFAYSARPLSYFLPATVHPVFGKFTESFIGTPLYGVSVTEHTLYLGWVPLLLAFLTFRRWRREVKSSVTDKERFYIGFFVLLAVVSWLFSQPPWWKIGPLKIYMPSFFMYRLLPMFRAYCRFGIVVMLAIAVLAGFGLKFILDKLHSNKYKIVVTALFCSMVLFEFWNWPPYKVIDVSKAPAVYYWLRGQPDELVIAEYPLDAGAPNVIYKLYQTTHLKKIINGTIPYTYAESFSLAITKLSDLKTAGILRWMGVRYVLVHKEDYLDTGLTVDKEEVDNIPRNAGLKLIRTFPSQDCPRTDIMCIQKTGPIDVYEVIAEPLKPEIAK